MAAGDTENYLTNPVNVYRLMKRLHTDWFLVEGRVQLMAEEMSELQGSSSRKRSCLYPSFYTDFNATREYGLSFPSQEDVEGAALALVRLQSTYKLDVAQVAAGILNGVKYG